MEKNIIFGVCMAFFLAMVVIPLPANANSSKGMHVTSSGIVNGIIDDQYGKRGTQFGPGGMPTYSMPLKIENAPKNTVSYAIVIDDLDAVPFCGFTWIHWVVANLEKNKLVANESIHASGFIQGANSWYGALGKLDQLTASVYGGMAPPDKTHTYNIRVFALDTKLPLKNGFFLNDLYTAMDGHILAESVLKGTYAN